MSMTDLPEWVWQVVEATQKYEDEHPMMDHPCLDGELKMLVPSEVWQAAQVMRARSSKAGA